MQQQARVRQGRRGRVDFLPVEVAGVERHAAVVARADGGEGVAVDGGVQDGAAVGLGVVGKIGAAAGKAEAERGARPHGQRPGGGSAGAAVRRVDAFVHLAVSRGLRLRIRPLTAAAQRRSPSHLHGGAWQAAPALAENGA